MKKHGRIALLGAGNMGEALIKGILNANLYKSESVSVYDSSPERRDYVKESYSVNISKDNRDAVSNADIVILAVKPQVIGGVIDDIRDVIGRERVIISIAAGISISRIFTFFGKKVKVIRVMPNAPALIRAGMSAISLSNEVSSEEASIVKEIFESIGRVVVLEEKYMDAVTGLSGSGPAYIFMVINSLADGGVKMGLSRDTALLLSAQTVLGAARMVLETKEHPERLKELVTSPGGTTIAGIHKLEEKGIRDAMISAVAAAAERSEELGRRE
ncbi:MAG: pyrroline-5-carboxylate reductase [Nitrospirota bacterium]